MPKRRKTYVLDTNVLLANAYSYNEFSDGDVVIPYVVLEEIDTFKKRDDSVGTNARIFARELNALRDKGSLFKGIKLNNGSKITVDGFSIEGPNPDTKIVLLCQSLSNVILVSNDINLILRADSVGVRTSFYEKDNSVDSISDLYTGSTSIEVADSVIDSFYNDELVKVSDLTKERLYSNQYITLVSSTNNSKAALSKVRPDGSLTKLIKPPANLGIKPRNREQQFVIDACLDPSISLVTITGQAGAGKTLCAMACGLYQVDKDGPYDKLIISRAMQPMGRDIGYLPGGWLEKIEPWIAPYRDSLDVLTHGRGKQSVDKIYQDLIEFGTLEIQVLTYIRGRSLPRSIFITDESQDLNRSELKTIVSRMGEGSKLILLGDVLQITNPYLDTLNSGLTHLIERFKGQSLYSHITLSKTERSDLASIACSLL